MKKIVLFVDDAGDGAGGGGKVRIVRKSEKMSIIANEKGGR